MFEVCVLLFVSSVEMEPETKVVSSEDQKEEPGNFAMPANVSTDSMSSPSCGASHSSGGARQSSGSSPFSGRASHSSGGATPFSGGASHSSGSASPFSGGASRSSGGATPFSSRASHSSGGASPFSGRASHSSGGASPFSGGASSSSSSASHSSGDASPFSGRTSRSSGGASRSSVFANPVGGSSEDGGITMHMGIKEIAGKSHSIKKKKKLPTQVALDAEGLLRTDFPFDQISARQKLRTLTHHTLFPVHPKKKTMEDWIADQKSTESLTVTTISSSGDLSNVSFVFGETKYGSYSCVDVQGTQEMMDGGSDVTNDAGGEDVTNNKNNNNMSSESTLGSAELFPSTPNATVAKSSLDDSPVDDAQCSSDSMTIGTVPETSLDELQGDANESDITVTEKSTGINHTAQVGQSALLVGGDGEKHVTIMVHSDVTGLVARISKQWKEYSKCMKNLSLTTSSVVSLPHLHSTAPPSKPAIGANVYNMTTSVTSKDASGKKIKIYVDEDLDIEHKMIEYRMRERKEDPTKGPEIGNYFLFASISLLEIV